MIFTSCQDKKIKDISTEIELEDELGGGKGTLINSNAVDFYFYYPENFTIQRSDAMIIVSISDSETQQTEKQVPISINPNLSAIVFSLQNDSYEKIEEYWENYALPGKEEIFKDIEVVSESDLPVDGVLAKKYVYTCSLSGMKFKIAEVIFFKRQQVYTLTYTATENKYDAYVNVLNTAAETFKFK